MMPNSRVSSSAHTDTDLDPQSFEAVDPDTLMTPEQLVREWEPSVGLDDVAITETLLDEAVKHLANILKLLPARYKHAENARLFVAQFQQPV
jgi:hypothetical protein